MTPVPSWTGPSISPETRQRRRCFGRVQLCWRVARKSGSDHRTCWSSVLVASGGRRLLLGSVSSALVQTAPCPVVVVTPDVANDARRPAANRSSLSHRFAWPYSTASPCAFAIARDFAWPVGRARWSSGGPRRESRWRQRWENDGFRGLAAIVNRRTRTATEHQPRERPLTTNRRRAPGAKRAQQLMVAVI